MLHKVLEKMRATVRDREMFYKAVMQTVMFYGRESWVTTEAGSMIDNRQILHRTEPEINWDRLPVS